MNDAILFEEMQTLSSKTLHQFFRATTCIFAFALIVNLLLQKGTIGDAAIGLFTGTALCLLAAIFSGFKMVMRIRTDGIYVRFPPLQPSFSKYLWSDIRDVYLRDYMPLQEYGGWGIKYGGNNGIGYIVAGNNTGLQIELRNGDKVLISTQSAHEVIEVLDTIWEGKKQAHGIDL